MHMKIEYKVEGGKAQNQERKHIIKQKQMFYPLFLSTLASIFKFTFSPV